MKELFIKFLPVSIAAASLVPNAFDAAGVEWQSICCVNWKEYPYCPEVRFRVAHDGKNIYVQYEVHEQTVRALADSDNGRVWEDACCEFFLAVSPDAYYNMECSCAGKLLVAWGHDRSNRETAPIDIVEKVDRWTSLGTDTFAEKETDGPWQLALSIPVGIFFKDHVDGLSGKVYRGNFYKCGDGLRNPHFVSWNPIDVPAPDFHRPDHFGALRFE
ncbi:MAG: carbohydrate-binding family 9-like protein [Prevotella sp.]